jgi:hypothetical protein
MPFTKTPFSNSAARRTCKHPLPSSDRIDIGAARSSNMAIPSQQVIHGRTLRTLSATQTLPPSSASSFSQHVTEETVSHQHRATFAPATPPFDHQIAHPPLASLSIRQFPFSTARETSSSGFRTAVPCPQHPSSDHLAPPSTISRPLHHDPLILTNYQSILCG